jgi:hypothetical protein
MERKKRNILLLSLLFSIFTLVYFVLSHLGYTRSFMLNIKSPASFLESYKKLPAAGGRTIIATTDTHNDRLTPVINSILDQTIRVNEIVVFTDKDKEYHNVVSKRIYSKNKNDNLTNSIVQSVLTEPDAETKIIIIESKIIPQDHIQLMLDYSNKNPNKIIKWDNSLLIKPKFFNSNVTNFNGKNLKDCCSVEQYTMKI